MQNITPGSRERVLVVGAGIGGVATAVALAQQGFEVDVVEITESTRQSIFGVGIIQPSNALRALDVIGAKDACLEIGFAAPAWGRKEDAQGNVLFEMPGAPIEGYPPMNGVTRPELHRILLERAAQEGVAVRYSTTFTSIDDRAESVRVEFSDGSAADYAVVVGADGVGSTVREQVLHAELRPTYIGQSAFRVNIPRLPGIDRIILQEGEAGMAGVVPIGPELAYFFLNVPWPDRSVRPTREELPGLLRGYLAEFGGLTGEIRDHHIHDDSDIVLRPEEGMIAPAPWHTGRVVLIGDAVHAVPPHLGQGAAQAIEDGVVLAEELAAADLASGASVAAALASYTERRYERCKLIVETCIGIGRYEIGTDPAFDHVGETQRTMEAMVAPL
jgi:2-polyprenyl-6-methoxyphenol hydroxylase-like FAD-dependent oxidoreductase